MVTLSDFTTQGASYMANCGLRYDFVWSSNAREKKEYTSASTGEIVS